LYKVDLSKNIMTKQKGFTLIELLVVIAIIGLLSTLAVVSLNSARSKARDARRTSDIRQVQTALEMYFNSENTYPIEATAVNLGEGTELTLDGADGFGAAISAPGYMSQVPSDPQTSTDHYIYQTDATGSTYRITFQLENDNSTWSCTAGGNCYAAPGVISSTDPGL
jgi:type II secretion system protein G